MKGVRYDFSKRQLSEGKPLTWADLEQFKTEFKQELLVEFKAILNQGFKGQSDSTKWLKSYQVEKLLGISSNTLLSLRKKGLIKFSKIGGIYYHNVEDINKLLESNNKAW